MYFPKRLLNAAWLLAAVACFLLGYRLYPYRHPLQPPHAQVREMAILSQAAEIDHPVTLMLGDSLTELAYLPSICQDTIFNAGVGNATLANTFALAQRVLKLIKPSKIIIAVGTNDAQTTIETPLEVFASQYKSLIEASRAEGAELYVANIPPIASTGRQIIDQSHILELNRIIENVAKTTGTPLIDFFGGMQPVNGFLPINLTVIDGVHLTPAGYKLWLHTLSSICPLGSQKNAF